MSILKGILIGLLSLLLLGSIGLYFSRDLILQKVIAKIERKAKAEKVALLINDASFTALTSIRIGSMTAVPYGCDTLLKVGEVNTTIKLMPLLIGSIRLEEVDIHQPLLQVVRKDSTSNIDFLFHRPSTTENTGKKQLDIGDLVGDLLDQVLYKIPDQLLIEDAQLILNDNGNIVKVLTPKLSITDHLLYSDVLYLRAADSTRLVLNGSIDASHKKLKFGLYSQGKPIRLPYIDEKYHALVEFDTITSSLDKVNFGKELELVGTWAIKGLTINHPKIAPKDIHLDSASINCTMFFGKNYVGIDSLSNARLGKVLCHPSIKYTMADSGKVYELNLNVDTCEAQDFFDAFPDGLFQALEGIQVSGKMSYKLHFKFDTANPDSLEFDSDLRKKDFRVTRYGAANLQKLNGSFTYTPYERDRAAASFTVGPENSNFTPIDQIPDVLKNAVITSEDGTFSYHHGFSEYAFRLAIAANYKAGRFKKGGSTISQQLVKNVFLNRNKNITRKLEEALIVWLMEGNYLVSKNRILEVYLNIIEWGPGVYGIGEASRFYFNKTPTQLTLGECIFLANIIPKPKAFKYTFDDRGALKPYVHYFYKLISGKMIRRGKITEADTVGMFNVKLIGPAKSFLIINDSIPDMEDGEDDLLPQKIIAPISDDDIILKESSLPSDQQRQAEQKEEKKRKGLFRRSGKDD